MLRSIAKVVVVPASQLRCSIVSRSFATGGERYTKDHEWVRVDNGVGTVGITDFAQKALGDLVFVDLPAIGKKFNQKQTLAVVESVKAASDVYAPVAGEVVEVNKKLVGEPALINKSPLADGWMVKIKLTDPSQVNALLDTAAYEKHCADSAH